MYIVYRVDCRGVERERETGTRKKKRGGGWRFIDRYTPSIIFIFIIYFLHRDQDQQKEKIRARGSRAMGKKDSVWLLLNPLRVCVCERERREKRRETDNGECGLLQLVL